MHLEAGHLLVLDVLVLVLVLVGLVIKDNQTVLTATLRNLIIRKMAIFKLARLTVINVKCAVEKVTLLTDVCKFFCAMTVTVMTANPEEVIEMFISA